ncbi:MAG: ChaB family protein [Nitrososphaeraceae archaeon]
MPKSKVQGRSRSRSSSSSSSRESKGKDKQISARTKKQIDSLPEHAQHIYKKTHASALEQYQNPEKRRGGKRQRPEEVAHKAAWAAVKKQYKKKGNEW